MTWARHSGRWDSMGPGSEQPVVVRAARHRLGWSLLTRLRVRPAQEHKGRNMQNIPALLGTWGPLSCSRSLPLPVLGNSGFWYIFSRAQQILPSSIRVLQRDKFSVCIFVCEGIFVCMHVYLHVFLYMHVCSYRHASIFQMSI